LFKAAVTELDLLTNELGDLLGIFAFHRNLLVVLMGRLDLVDTFIILLEYHALEVKYTFLVDLVVLLALVASYTFQERIEVRLDMASLVTFLALEAVHIPYQDYFWLVGFLLEVEVLQHLGVLHCLKVALGQSCLIINFNYNRLLI